MEEIQTIYRRFFNYYLLCIIIHFYAIPPFDLESKGNILVVVAIVIDVVVVVVPPILNKYSYRQQRTKKAQGLRDVIRTTKAIIPPIRRSNPVPAPMKKPSRRLEHFLNKETN